MALSEDWTVFRCGLRLAVAASPVVGRELRGACEGVPSKRSSRGLRWVMWRSRPRLRTLCVPFRPLVKSVGPDSGAFRETHRTLCERVFLPGPPRPPQGAASRRSDREGTSPRALAVLPPLLSGCLSGQSRHSMEVTRDALETGTGVVCVSVHGEL